VAIGTDLDIDGKHPPEKSGPLDRTSRCREAQGCARATIGQDVQVSRSTGMCESDQLIREAGGVDCSVVDSLGSAGVDVFPWGTIRLRRLAFGANTPWSLSHIPVLRDTGTSCTLVSDEIQSWVGHQGGQALQKLQWLHDQMSGSIPVGSFQLQHHIMQIVSGFHYFPTEVAVQLKRIPEVIYLRLGHWQRLPVVQHHAATPDYHPHPGTPSSRHRRMWC